MLSLCLHKFPRWEFVTVRSTVCWFCDRLMHEPAIRIISLITYQCCNTFFSDSHRGNLLSLRFLSECLLMRKDPDHCFWNSPNKVVEIKGQASAVLHCVYAHTGEGDKIPTVGIFSSGENEVFSLERDFPLASHITWSAVCFLPSGGAAGWSREVLPYFGSLSAYTYYCQFLSCFARTAIADEMCELTGLVAPVPFSADVK